MVETDVLVNLDDPRTKDIAEAITNKTSKQILQYLAKENMSVSEISRNLKLPLNTVDYNIQKLAKAGLIEKKSFFWSPKGRKMHVYGVSNKRIIINPSSLGGKAVYGLAFLVTGLIALSAKGMQYLRQSAYATDMAPMEETLLYSAQTLSASEKIAPIVRETATYSSSFTLSLGSIEWFLIGAWLAIILLMVISVVKDKRKKI
jgi:DNA-binding transcriptional ArsR family regulator